MSQHSHDYPMELTEQQAEAIARADLGDATEPDEPLSPFMHAEIRRYLLDAEEHQRLAMLDSMPTD